MADILRMEMGQWQLASLVLGSGCENARFQLPDGRWAVLQSVLRESGCGRSFVVEAVVSKPYPTPSETVRVLVRCPK